MQGTHLSDLRTRLSSSCGRIRALMLLIVFVCISSRAFGQEYFTLPIDEKAKSDRNVALQYLKNAAGGNQVKFVNYFQNYYLPAMTRTEPDKLGELAKQREDLFKRTLWPAGNAAAQKELTDMAFKAMGQIVAAKDPPAHPAARYNAILIIGQLDQKYSPDGRQPPEPLVAANKPLTAVVDSATTSDRFPPAVILGAIIGLERHAQYRQALSPEAVSAMSAALLKLVTHDAPIQEMDRNAYSWMRLRAATALARLGTVGDKNAVHDAIVKLASTSKSIDDRCAAAALLERLEYKDVKLDDAGTSEPLFALARDLAAAEDKLAQEFQEQQVGGGIGVAPGRFASQRFAEGGLSGTEVVETFPRRQALARINDLRNGLKKVKPALTEESQKKADAVLAALNQAITACANKDTVELTLVDELRKMAEAINTAVPPAENAAADKAQEDAAFK
jgi:hypothetical protein